MKKCCRCGETKPVSEFSRDKSRRDGYDNLCKQCKKKKARKYYAEHSKELLEYQREYRCKYPEKVRKRQKEYNSANPNVKRGSSRKWHLSSTYGMTLKEYDFMLELQGGNCAICGKTPEENGRRLCVDHDHETGEVRGLLCTDCNLAIGLFQDSPSLCKQAELYLLDW